MDYVNLPDEVQEFKRFVKKRDGIIEDVRRGKYTWQELFDIWYRSGEDDAIFEKYEPIEQEEDNQRKSTDLMNKFSNVFDVISKIDLDEFEKQVHNFSKTIDQVQDFLKNTNKNSSSNTNSPNSDQYSFQNQYTDTFQDPYHPYNQRKRFF